MPYAIGWQISADSFETCQNESLMILNMSEESTSDSRKSRNFVTKIPFKQGLSKKAYERLVVSSWLKKGPVPTKNRIGLLTQFGSLNKLKPIGDAEDLFFVFIVSWSK